jgi:hypothetical protein
MKTFWRYLLAAGIFALSNASTAGNSLCRVVFDMGSSGIRAGASSSASVAHFDLDYLGPQWAGRSLDETIAPTIAALCGLPETAGFPAECTRVGGGFSAWRLALNNDPARLVGQLRRIQEESGVAVLVIPQSREGAYGYIGARRLLGDGLTTSHVLDIGGGSLQVAGEHSSWGDMLGQKAWQRRLCQEIRNSETAPCDLQPMTGDELAIARQLLEEPLAGLAEIPKPVTLTAISRPVSRGVLPALQRLNGNDNKFIERAALSAAIERVARLDPRESIAATGIPAPFSGWLLSDMLLVEGILQNLAVDRLDVAEIDLTNIPGLLADDQATAWSGHYRCYLQRLQETGINAYASDPASCPE